jgi:hypothetical protein
LIHDKEDFRSRFDLKEEDKDKVMVSRGKPLQTPGIHNIWTFIGEGSELVAP